MHNPSRERYLDELGIPEFLYTTKKLNSAELETKKTKVKCLVIESTKKGSFCVEGESRELLLKMISAVGLSINDIQCINIKKDDLKNEISNYDAGAVLMMSDNLSVYGNNQFITHHPSEITGNNNLKRESWEVLKVMKKCL
jgi:hypothetical protein